MTVTALFHVGRRLKFQTGSQKIPLYRRDLLF